MQPPNPDHIELEIQYPQYKNCAHHNRNDYLWDIRYLLRVFFAGKAGFFQFQKEVQVAKQLQITDMQNRIQKYAISHNIENLQSALPVLFSKHPKLKLQGDVVLQENVIATRSQEQHLELYVLDGAFYIQVDEQKDILSLPILLQELQELGLWVYGIQFMDEEKFKKDNQLAQTQTEGTGSSNGDSIKKKSHKKEIYKKIIKEENTRTRNTKDFL